MDQSQPLSLYVSGRGVLGNNYPDGDEVGERAHQMCGQAVLTKILAKANLSKRHSIESGEEGGVFRSPKTCFSTPPKQVIPFYRRRYEEVAGPLQSPETDSSSSSASSEKSAEEKLNSKGNADSPDTPENEGPSFPAQFQPESLENDVTSYQVRNRHDSHSPYRNAILASVTEEASSYDTEDQSHHEGDASAVTSPMRANYVKKQPKQDREMPREPSQTEKNTEMIMSLRNLVHKQQAALKDLAQQNSHYCKKLGEYQNLLIKMRQEQVEKQRQIDQLVLEKETYEADALWMKEEFTSVQRDLDADMSDSALKSKLSALLKECNLNSPRTPPRTPRSGSATPVRKTPSFQSEMETVSSFKEKTRRVLSPGSTEKALEGGALWNHNATSSSFELWEYDARDELNASLDDSMNHSGRRDDAGSTSSSVYSYRSSDGERNRTKEEVALFKQRLDSLQKKRSQRQTARKESSRTVVRFGSLTC